MMLVATIGYFVYVGVKPWLRFFWMPILLVVLWVIGVSGADKATPGLVYETESAYNYIQVIEQDSYRYLRLNEGQGIHSIYHPTQLIYYGPWSQVLVAPFFNATPRPLDSIKKLAIVGLAAGTTSRQASIVFPEIKIDGFEIDSEIVRIGKEYFEMNQPNLNITTEDGRWGLAHSKEKYDIVSVDAYRPPYIPWHMTTLEFFTIVHEHLEDDGVLVVNIGRSPLNRALVNDLATTIKQVFRDVFVTDLPDSFNSILFATKKPGSWDHVSENYFNLSENDADPLLLEAMAIAYNNRQPPPETTRVYTDDRTPIEWLTNKIVVDFLLSGGMEMMK